MDQKFRELKNMLKKIEAPEVDALRRANKTSK